MIRYGKKCGDTVKCLVCNTEVVSVAPKQMTRCKCGEIAVDGCEYYTRVIGKSNNWELVKGDCDA